MSHYFLDSSALVKRYLSEVGSSWVLVLTAATTGNTILIAEITPVEVVAGATRQQRMGRRNPYTPHGVRNLIDHDAVQVYNIVPLTPQILAHAEDLILAHPLRAYDAVQLASALAANSELLARGLAPLTIVASDKDLLAAAQAERLATDDPHAHP